jgi:L,D-peptidoglycan transpeptidase YkuD (ErfK/YbiS/YcfS/YnhG family)
VNKKAGIGTVLFFILLIVVAARNDDGDWFNPGRKSSSFDVPNPSEIWNSSLLGDAQQVLVVATASWDSTTAKVALFEKTDSGWNKAVGELNAKIGKQGVRQIRSEGDGSTPAGGFRIGTALGEKTEIDTDLRYQQIEQGGCWISEAGADYNRWTTRSPCNAPNVDLYAGRTGVFERAAVIDFNPQRVAGAGSALFLYQQTEATSTATNGSVALDEGDLVKVLKRLDTDDRPRIVIGPASWLTGTSSGSSGSGSSGDSGWEAVSKGSSGERVRQVQYALTAAGYPTKVDGSFADETDANVRKFQADRKLTVDGVVGTETARALGLIS